LVNWFKKFAVILRNSNVQHRAHKSPSLHTILSHMNWVHNLPLCIFKVHCNFTLLSYVTPSRCVLSNKCLSFRTTRLYRFYLMIFFNSSTCFGCLFQPLPRRNTSSFLFPVVSSLRGFQTETLYSIFTLFHALFVFC